MQGPWARAAATISQTLTIRIVQSRAEWAYLPMVFLVNGEIWVGWQGHSGASPFQA